jgi:phosphate transport system ATP-binding protein
MRELVDRCTLVIVTHNMQQAQRVSSHAGFMLLGELVEFGPTEPLFAASRDRRTADYVSGRFG